MSAITTMTELMNELERVRALLRQREEELVATRRALQTMREVNDHDAKYQVELEGQLAAMTVQYQEMVKFYDKHHGTPCEEIRHRQEVESLTTQLATSQARCKELEHGLTENGIDFTVAERPPA